MGDRFDRNRVEIYESKAKGFKDELLGVHFLQHGFNFEIEFTENGVEITYEELEFTFPTRKKMI